MHCSGVGSKRLPVSELNFVPFWPVWGSGDIVSSFTSLSSPDPTSIQTSLHELWPATWNPPCNEISCTHAKGIGLRFPVPKFRSCTANRIAHSYKLWINWKKNLFFLSLLPFYSQQQSSRGWWVASGKSVFCCFITLFNIHLDLPSFHHILDCEISFLFIPERHIYATLLSSEITSTTCPRGKILKKVIEWGGKSDGQILSGKEGKLVKQLGWQHT